MLLAGEEVVSRMISVGDLVMEKRSDTLGDEIDKPVWYRSRVAARPAVYDGMVALMELVTLLEIEDCEILGPADDVCSAPPLLWKDKPDIAVLDYELTAGTHALESIGVPCVLLNGDHPVRNVQHLPGSASR